MFCLQVVQVTKGVVLDAVASCPRLMDVIQNVVDLAGCSVRDKVGMELVLFYLGFT